jgi:hypothetical protein
MKAILGATVFLGLLSSIFIPPAFACRGPFPSFEKSLSNAKTVFIGRIVSVKTLAPPSLGEDTVAVTFAVDRSWKGNVGKTIMVLSGTDSCSFARGGYRNIGEKWLILASAGPKVSTSLLSGNVWLGDKTHPVTKEKIPKLLERKLGKGRIPSAP